MDEQGQEPRVGAVMRGLADRIREARASAAPGDFITVPVSDAELFDLDRELRQTRVADALEAIARYAGEAQVAMQVRGGDAALLGSMTPLAFECGQSPCDYKWARDLPKTLRKELLYVDGARRQSCCRPSDVPANSLSELRALAVNHLASMGIEAAPVLFFMSHQADSLYVAVPIPDQPAPP